MKKLTYRHYLITGVVVFFCYQLWRIAPMTTKPAEAQSDLLPYLIPVLLMIPLTRWTKSEMRNILRTIRGKEELPDDIPTGPKEH